MSITHAMVMAAGKGTRMRPLTDRVPKPLVEVAGKPLIDHALARLSEIGIEQAVVNVHHLADQLEMHLGEHTAPSITISDERALLLETGGGLIRALPHLGSEPFLVINSDAIWTGQNALAPLIEAWDSTRMDALLLLTRREDAIGYSRAGDFFLKDLRLSRRGDASTAPFVYTGAQIINPRCLKGFIAEPFSLNLVWDQLIPAGRACGVVGGASWCDVGTPEGRDLAEAALLGGSTG